MNKLLVSILFAVVTLGLADAAQPKVGCTIALSDHHSNYRSNAFFRQRPVSVQMIKDGIDLCLYNGWGKSDPVTSLKQFNAIWLITEHENMADDSVEKTTAALKAYVEQGGGLVVCFSSGRYPEAPVDAYWTAVMKTFGADLLHEEIFNPETEVKVDDRRNLFYTADLVKHPITAGIPGLWLADRSGGTWGSVAVRYSPEWKVLVTGGKGSLSRPKNLRTNEIELGKPGYYKHDAPIVAARSYGKGRFVFVASHKDSCGWMYGIDKWPNYPERSQYLGKPSDMLGLIENALRWVSEPSAKEAGFVAHYRPVEPVIPAYCPQPDFGLRELEKAAYPSSFKPGNRTVGARGLVGVRSAYSDGESTVPEYVAAAKEAGLNFLVFCDPLEHLTAEKLAALRVDCAKNSSDDFYCCPGVEYVDSSGLEWGLWHDKVEFPDPKPFVKDGRTYRQFDGKRILQRNEYGGHQNLYRGVLLNMKKVAENGNDLINLAYLNAVSPKVFDVDKRVFDNAPEYLRVGHNLHRAATVSYTRVRSAADVDRAAETAVTCGSDLKAIRNWANAQGGWGGHDAANRADLQAVYGAGIEIRDFSLQRAQGTDVERVVVRVVCPKGVGEVALLDGDRRVLARFAAKGEMDFARSFDILHDRQMALILIARGKDGSEAVSTAKWLCYYHAGMFRCGDNSNLLSQNPNVIESLHWDDVMVPPAKAVFKPSLHFHVSEGRLWDAYYKLPSQRPSAHCWGAYSRIFVRGSGYPSEKVGLPSSRSVSTLNQPNVVSIFDQYQGDSIMEPTRSEKNATYAKCSLVKKIGPGRFWRRHHRVYQFVDRHDGWWRAVYKQDSPGYRGGYSIVEGSIEFTEDAELAAPIDLVRIDAANPLKAPDIYARNEKAFSADSYYALHAMDEEWYGLFGLEGSDELHVTESKIPQGVRGTLQLGAAGQKFRNGDRLVYRFAIGSFIENPREGQYCAWFAQMMNGVGFEHGEAKVNGIIELTAKGNLASLTCGGRAFIQNYPVRVAGLVDNGCAYVTDGGKIWRPMAFDGSMAYAEIPLEEKKTWHFLNLVVADDPALRLTYVPRLPGHAQPTVEVFNPTLKDVTTYIRVIRKNTTLKVTIPAGSMVEVKIGEVF